MLQKECAICHKHNVGIFNEKLILRDHGRICKDCARRLFTKPKSFDAMKWASQHTSEQVRRLLTAGKKVDARQWWLAKKDEDKRQKSTFESLRQKFVYNRAQRLGQCYFNPRQHAILFPPLHNHTYKVIDDNFIIGYTPVEKGHLAQQKAHHEGFSSSGHNYKQVDQLGIIITLRNGANYLVDFIKGETKQGYTTERAYEEFKQAQEILAAIIRKNNRPADSAPLHTSSI